MTARQSFPVATPVLRVVLRKFRFFGKYGERYDRRLFAYIEACIGLYLEFADSGLLQSDSSEFSQICRIRDHMLDKGQRLYYEFP
ncbi:MAG: hypothetical protein HQ498_09265 [Pseudohongiella sp.]|nr:hypothetical protein [Pseudohongiella sp.]